LRRTSLEKATDTNPCGAWDLVAANETRNAKRCATGANIVAPTPVGASIPAQRQLGREIQ